MCISAANRALLFLAAWGLAGCTVGPDFERPAAPQVKNYADGGDPAQTVEAAGSRQQFLAAKNVPADWWRLFDSPELNDAVRRGLEGSPTIAIAQASLKQAQDELASGEGALYPQIAVGAGVSRQQPSANGNPSRLQPGAYNLFSLTGAVSYVLDIFGGQRRSIEALGAGVDYAENADRAAALSLAATIADTLVASAAYRAEIAATTAIIQQEENQVRLAHVLVTAGTENYAAELSLQGQLETARASLPILQQQLTRSEHLLAVLQGQLPAEGRTSEIDLDRLSLPPKIPVSVPSLLVQHRPDILQAEASLHAASAEIGVATAAMLPSFTLDGTVGYSSLSSSNILAPQSNLWGLAASVSQPVFNGGMLWYRRQAARDAFVGAQAQYRQAVLTAFEQVADALRALEHDAGTLAANEGALQSAQKAARLVEANYGAGLASYSAVLLANAQLRQVQIAEIQSKAQRYQDTVALFVSLGGGWWSDQPLKNAGER